MNDQPIVPGGNALVERAKSILLKPAETWPTIAAEPATPGDLITRYALPLAAIAPVASFIGMQVFGLSFLGVTYKPSLMSGLSMLVTQFVMAIIGVVVLALVADFLAPKFGGKSDRTNAFKLVTYSMTAAWLAGIFGLIPSLAILSIVGLYSLYLLYLGVGHLMQVPKEQALAYTAVTVVAGVLLMILANMVAAQFAGAGPSAAAIAAGAATASTDGEVTIDGVGKLDTGKLEETVKRLEAATNGEIKPVAASALQDLLPAALGAYQRTEVSSAGAGGIGSQAEGTYRSGDKAIKLQIVDMSGLGAIAGLGEAMGVEQSRQTADGYERTGTVDGAMQTEEWNTRESRGQFGRIVAERFMIEAEGQAGSIDELKAAVASVDEGRLAALTR